MNRIILAFTILIGFSFSNISEAQNFGKFKNPLSALTGEKEETEKKEAFNKMIRDRYANELQKLIDKYPGDTGNWDDIEFWPSISTCFGPEAIDKNYTLIVEKYETWTSASGKDYHFYNGNKTRTPIASCIGFRRNYE